MNLVTQTAVAASLSQARAVSVIPDGLRAPVDLLALIQGYGDAKFGDGYRLAKDRSRLEYGDTADLGEITEEVERLQGAEFERDELVKASTGVLLVLSLLTNDIDAMGCGSRRAVDAFVAALSEVRS